MTDSDKSLWEDVEEKAPHKLLHVEYHHFSFVVVLAIAIAEMDLSVFHFEEAVIADRDSMGILAKIIDDLFRASEWFFGINDPGFSRRFNEKTLESDGISQPLDLFRESELSFLVKIF